MSSIANQTNEINTGQYTQHSVAVPKNTVTTIYTATNDCTIIFINNTGTPYFKINGASSSSSYDFTINTSTSSCEVLINNASVFNKNINHICSQKSSVSIRPYIKMDLSKGDYISSFSAGSDISITYYVRSN